MIKQMIRIFILPIQSIFDAICHQRKKRLMMSYTLKISPKQNPCALMKEVTVKNTRLKQINFAHTASNGV